MKSVLHPLIMKSVLHPLDCALDLFQGQTTRKSDADREQSLVRAKLHGQDFAEVFAGEQFSVGNAPGIKIERRGNAEYRENSSPGGLAPLHETTGRHHGNRRAPADTEDANSHKQRIEIESFAVTK